MTQELIENMLGVRRKSVTESAGKLQRTGLISNHRGSISRPDQTDRQADQVEDQGEHVDQFLRGHAGSRALMGACWGERRQSATVIISGRHNRTECG
ncbi:helix-turn-helix domain-containing protein [Billgrantia montanilacus]|uniref:helix-turn-helix domain-containing protein n=1 Tax=Billgrantia montanilacus TaxID=2282305 RepID=UPI001FE48E2C|nr:helix-turn-helix domain-containing protein [Halomonas montanilacus]